MSRGFKALIAVPSAAIAVLLSIAAITAFLIVTGINFFAAMGGALTAVAGWLALLSAMHRLFPDQAENPDWSRPDRS